MNSIRTLTKEEYVADCWRKAQDYCEGVEDGTIVANENIRLAVRRHVLDLQRDDLEWRPEMVEKVYKFFSYLYIDKDKQFILEPFQAFIILALFGLYYTNTNVRKYLYAFLFVGRKNGKTALASAMQLYFMLADGVTFPQSVLVASTQQQANDTAFKELRQMIMCSPALEKRLEVQQSNKIIFRDRKRYGWCKTVPALTDKLEGLNPSSAIIDEIHTYKNSQKFNVIKNALGTKENPMLFLISTAGFGKDSFCAQLVETGRNVLRGVSDDDRFFYLLYELEEGDDIEDESVWIKANPGLGTILDYTLFRDQFNTNKTIPSLLDDFVIKRFNIFIDEMSSWIQTDVLLEAFRPLDEEIIKSLPCYVGVDLSSTRDLTSVVCVWFGDDTIYVRPYFFFANNSTNILRRGNVNIAEWVSRGYVTQCQTPTIDYDLLLDRIKRINRDYDVQGLFYDPWHFDRLLNEVKEEGIWAVPIPPGVRNFDPAIRFTEERFYEKKIHIEDNKCMIWNFKNVLISRDMNGNMKPNKNESADAIDGVVAQLNAIAGYLQINKSSANNFMLNALK